MDHRFVEPHSHGGPPAPVALDAQEIKDEIRAWRDAAARSADAGFDVLEIHGAHGYLINQFLSPVGNHRTDAYGGDLQSRMRFALELTEAVRAAWPHDKPLFFRVSVMDGKGGHWDMDDTVVLAKELKQRGVDFIDCSYGGLTGESNMPELSVVCRDTTLCTPTRAPRGRHCNHRRWHDHRTRAG
jgi:2,4-dienoyl-CoA reductase-like NADH-dependent reductase (Old Yellow Enzyme family)